MMSNPEILKSTQKPRMFIRGSNARAFSFAEVMFAVVILGIGFIMVAAVFPVAIRQTQTTGEENSAANAARAAALAISSAPQTQTNQLYVPGYVPVPSTPGGLPYTDQYAYRSVQTMPIFPPTVKNNVAGYPTNIAPAPPAIVVPFTGARWDLIKANLINNLDPRYSYIPFYRRENNSTIAELIVIAVTNRNKAGYDASDFQNSSGAETQYPATVQSGARTLLAPPKPTDTPLTTPTPSQIYADTVTVTSTGTGLAANDSWEGYTVSLHENKDASGNVVPPATSPVLRTYTLGRCLTAGNYELIPPDGVALTAGTVNGWGSGGAIVDPVLGPVSNEPRMTGADSSYCTLNVPTALQPTVAYATLVSNAATPNGYIMLSNDPIHIKLPPAAVQGAFVIVADDYPYSYNNPTSAQYPLPGNNTAALPPYRMGSLNGRIFRLGPPLVPNPDSVNQGGAFLLDPAYGMRPVATGMTFSPDQFFISSTTTLSYPQPATIPYAQFVSNQRIKVYIVGAGKTSATATAAGAAQDMGIFATFFQIQ